MPNPICGPRGAIAAADIDVSEWAGENLIDLGGGSFIAAPSTWDTFEDVLALLTGRGCGVALSGSGVALIDLAADAATATGTTVTATINANDRFELTFTGATSVKLAASADNDVFGFDAAGQTSVASGGNQVLTAVADWDRGNIENAQLGLTRGSFSGFAPAVAYRAHSAVHTVRRWGIGDLDDSAPTTNLMAIDLNATWGITADGRVWRAYNSASSTALAWASTTFRDALGFDGTELTQVFMGGLRVMTANKPCQWLLTPSRPLENVYRGRRRYGTSTQATDRSAYLVEWMSPDEFTVSGFVDGPADRIDRQDHWLRRVWPYISPGARVNIYQDWSDGRRGRREYDTASIASGGKVLPYGVLYTSQRDGEYGRWLCRRSVDDPAGFTAEWPSRMRRRMPFTLKLHNYEGEQ